MPRVVLIFAASLVAVAAHAADLPAVSATDANPQPSSAVPTIGVDPTSTADFWKGFYVGTGISVVGFKGEKGAVGGEVFAGYDHTFDDHVVLGVRFSTGYSPWAFPGGPYRGFSFGEADVKLGYAMGRLTPYVIAGAALARPSYGADFGDLSQSVNGLFAGPGAVQAVGTAGVGFDYAVTNNVTVGLEARVSNGGPLSPLGPMH